MTGSSPTTIIFPAFASTTMLSSKSARPNKSPIDTVPYDVLFEIFVLCLPRDRLEVCQPNTKIAPMLLCHVCSCWRAVALRSPILWSHLSVSLKDRDIEDDPESFSFREDKIEFMQWWKKNLGSIAPFFRLDIEMADDGPGIALEFGGRTGYRFFKSRGDGIGILLARDDIAFVMDYLTKAQHLEVVWKHALAIAKLGDYDSYPNLHTLVTRQWTHPIDNHFHRTFPVLRRLAILDDHMSFADINIPSQWLTLTHLSISAYKICATFWVPLTLAVPCLQWAYIAFKCLDANEYSNPITRTLPQLSTLFIECRGDGIISPLFNGLHLPALSNFFLASAINEWFVANGMSDIYTILQSTPAVRNLTLRKCNSLTSNEMDYAKGTLGTTTDIAPIWHAAPRLFHLQLELYITVQYNKNMVKEVLDNFARHSFLSADNRWLDLDNSACPIRMITIMDCGFIDGGGYDKTSSIRKCNNASTIPLRIISKPFSNHGELWMEWRSGN